MQCLDKDWATHANFKIWVTLIKFTFLSILVGKAESLKF